MRHALFAADELAPGEKRRVEIDGRGVLVVHAENGNFYAVADTCPHQGARLSEGVVTGEFRASSIGKTELSRFGEIVRCPWHNFSYDLTTGESLLQPERYRVKAYPTYVEDGTVTLDL